MSLNQHFSYSLFTFLVLASFSCRSSFWGSICYQRAVLVNADIEISFTPSALTGVTSARPHGALTEQLQDYVCTSLDGPNCLMVNDEAPEADTNTQLEEAVTDLLSSILTSQKKKKKKQKKNKAKTSKSDDEEEDKGDSDDENDDDDDNDDDEVDASSLLSELLSGLGLDGADTQVQMKVIDLSDLFGGNEDDYDQDDYDDDDDDDDANDDGKKKQNNNKQLRRNKIMMEQIKALQDELAGSIDLAALQEQLGGGGGGGGGLGQAVEMAELQAYVLGEDGQAQILDQEDLFNLLQGAGIDGDGDGDGDGAKNVLSLLNKLQGGLSDHGEDEDEYSDFIDEDLEGEEKEQEDDNDDI